jgi:hypothetical protein
MGNDPATLGGFTTYAGLLASPYYAGQVQEVQALGRVTGSTRTADQTRIAWFWANDLDGTYRPLSSSSNIRRSSHSPNWRILSPRL